MTAKQIVLLALLCLIGLGCTKGNHYQLAIAQPLIPSVVADSTGEFVFAAGVKNLSSEALPETFLKVLVKWDPLLTCGISTAAQNEKVFPILPLQPGETWSIDSTRVADVGQIGCSCKQGVCGGTIYFTLLRDDFPVAAFSGTNTSLQLQWDKDGDVANILQDVSGSIPE